jgi:hypothetical protein
VDLVAAEVAAEAASSSAVAASNRLLFEKQEC